MLFEFILPDAPVIFPAVDEQRTMAFAALGRSRKGRGYAMRRGAADAVYPPGEKPVGDGNGARIKAGS